LTRRTAIEILAGGGAAASVSAGQTTPAATGRWVLQYFYDRDDETFRLTDLRFPSAQLGIAFGAAQRKDKRPKALALVTRNGGTNWTEQELPDFPRSAFFLNESLGWMAGEKGIWRTEEGGREWKRLKRISTIGRVFFQDPDQGWAIGAEKTVLRTQDGGRTWNEVPEAGKPSTNPEHTTYNWIEWAGPKTGIMVGSAVPPRRDRIDMPVWIDPLGAAARRQWPAITIALETFDAGQTWGAQTVPAFGTTTRVRAAVEGHSLILVRFFESFEFPSEVYLSKPKPGGLQRLFREKNRVVTDLGWWTPTKILLATIEPPGRLHQLPIPGKLHMLSSTNMVDWTEMKVDYRAVGTEAVLAMVDDRNLWVGTDAGQILRYTD
jgi:hypothetical protein